MPRIVMENQTKDLPSFHLMCLPRKPCFNNTILTKKTKKTKHLIIAQKPSKIPTKQTTNNRSNKINPLDSPPSTTITDVRDESEGIVLTISPPPTTLTINRLLLFLIIPAP